MKHYISKHIPKIQTDDVAGHASVGHLVVVKTWRRALETRGEIGISRHLTWRSC